jgi:hypothetical protein
MPAPFKCCYCRLAIEPVDGKWVGVQDGKPACKHSPNRKHARQVVIQPCS